MAKDTDWRCADDPAAGREVMYPDDALEDGTDDIAGERVEAVDAVRALYGDDRDEAGEFTAVYAFAAFAEGCGVWGELEARGSKGGETVSENSVFFS